MGLLYADALGGYTDPATSGLKHMRADGEWAAPDAGYKFLDATGEWSVPELGPRPFPPDDIGSATWEEIGRLADLAAADPTSYERYIGQEKSFAYGGNLVTARIVDIAKETTPDGGVVGFIFHVYKGMEQHTMNDDRDTPGGYAGSDMRTWLESLEFPASLHPQEFTLRYRPEESADAQTIEVTVGLMASANLYWDGCEGLNGNIDYVHADEGEPYRYFIDNDTIESRTHYGFSWGEYVSRGAWLLSPTYRHTQFAYTWNGVLSTGTADIYELPSVRFCLGHYKAG